MNVRPEGTELFIPGHTPKFVGLLMAYHFRRSMARTGAVNHGTAHTIPTPLSSPLTNEISLFYHEILASIERDERSERLYEEAATLTINIDTMSKQLKADDLTEEERRGLLIKIDKAMVELEVVTGQMEKLADD